MWIKTNTALLDGTTSVSNQYLGPFMTDQNILTLLVFVVWEGGLRLLMQGQLTDHHLTLYSPKQNNL